MAELIDFDTMERMYEQMTKGSAQPEVVFRVLAQTETVERSVLTVECVVCHEIRAYPTVGDMLEHACKEITK